VRVIRRLPHGAPGMTAFASEIFNVPRASIRQAYDTTRTRYQCLPRFARCQFDPALNGIAGMLEEMDDEIGTVHHEARQLYVNMPRFSEREITPDWVFNDLALRRFLLHVFPRLQKDGRDRMWARRWAALLYMYYRLHLPSKEVARRLGMKIKAVEISILRIRKRGEAFFL